MIHNAIVTFASIELENCLTLRLGLDYGGAFQTFGNFALGGEPGTKAGDHIKQPNWTAEWIVSVLRACDAESLDKCVGKVIRVERESDKYAAGIKGIGHCVRDDRWFYPEQSRKNFEPSRLILLANTDPTATV